MTEEFAPELDKVRAIVRNFLEKKAIAKSAAAESKQAAEELDTAHKEGLLDSFFDSRSMCYAFPGVSFKSVPTTTYSMKSYSISLQEAMEKERIDGIAVPTISCSLRAKIT
mgnify:CR=1 FL=1